MGRNRATSSSSVPGAYPESLSRGNISFAPSMLALSHLRTEALPSHHQSSRISSFPVTSSPVSGTYLRYDNIQHDGQESNTTMHNWLPTRWPEIATPSDASSPSTRP